MLGKWFSLFDQISFELNVAVFYSLTTAIPRVSISWPKVIRQEVLASVDLNVVNKLSKSERMNERKDWGYNKSLQEIDSIAWQLLLPPICRINLSPVIK